MLQTSGVAVYASCHRHRGLRKTRLPLVANHYGVGFAPTRFHAGFAPLTSAFLTAPGFAGTIEGRPSELPLTPISTELHRASICFSSVHVYNGCGFPSCVARGMADVACDSDTEAVFLPRPCPVEIRFVLDLRE